VWSRNEGLRSTGENVTSILMVSLLRHIGCVRAPTADGTHHLLPPSLPPSVLLPRPKTSIHLLHSALESIVSEISVTLLTVQGHAVAQSLRSSATCRKVAGSRPDEVKF
jgi:hypothetical protein